MVKTWFTSDTHFGHFNIIKYTNRPFKSLEDMNNEIIKRWNEKVKPEDTIYFLGDFFFKNSKKGNGDIYKFDYYDSKLNGKKIYIKGNHEHSNDVKSHITALILEFGGVEVYCTHRPQDSNNNFKLNLCGHVHEKWKSREDTKFGATTVLINVGVDVWNFYPVSIQEILNEYNKYLFKHVVL